VKDDPFEPGSRLVFYARDSGGGEQDLSTAQQEQAARAWCAERGHILTRAFIDAARPGSTTAGRQAFEELIQYLRGGGEGEQGVIIWKWNRFARDIDDAQYFRADIRRRGFEIFSLQDNIPAGLEGRLIESAIDYMNQRYLADLSSDVARGQKYLAQVYHAFPLGRTPVGLRRVPFEIGAHRDGRPHVVSKLEPDPMTAPLVRRAFELRAAGAVYREIHAAVRLFESKPSYSKVLRHTLYIGRFVYQDLVIDGFCDPIVPLPLWQAVQRINADWQEKRNHPRRAASRFLLSGLVACGLCGRPMVGKTTHAPKWPTSRFDYYRCTYSSELERCKARMIPKDALEARALARLVEYVQRRDVLEAVYQETARLAQESSAETDPALARARMELVKLEGEIKNLLSAIKAAGHSSAILAELAALETRRGELAAQVAALEGQRSRAKLAVTLEQVLNVGAQLAGRLLAAEEREQQQLLRSFVRVVTAWKVDGEIMGEITFVLFEREISLPL